MAVSSPTSTDGHRNQSQWCHRLSLWSSLKQADKSSSSDSVFLHVVQRELVIQMGIQDHFLQKGKHKLATCWVLSFHYNFVKITRWSSIWFPPPKILASVIYQLFSRSEQRCFSWEFQWSLVNERSGQLLISRGIWFYLTQIIMHLLLETLSTVTVLFSQHFLWRKLRFPIYFSPMWLMKY